MVNSDRMGRDRAVTSKASNVPEDAVPHKVLQVGLKAELR